jgi:hypothetical protein
MVSKSNYFPIKHSLPSMSKLLLYFSEHFCATLRSNINYGAHFRGGGCWQAEKRFFEEFF